MNKMFVCDICEYFMVISEQVSQEIENEKITLCCKDRGILTNVAELLSYCGFIVRYNAGQRISVTCP